MNNNKNASEQYVEMIGRRLGEARSMEEFKQTADNIIKELGLLQSIFDAKLKEAQ